MKALITAASVAALAALLPAAASAQTAANTGTSVYGTLGYADANGDSLNLGTIQGRLGARFGQYVGVEGELAFGIDGDKTTANGTELKANIQHQAAIYGVGFLPLSPQFDLLARIGYGETRTKTNSVLASVSTDADSWNYGVGGQYRFDDKNGIRADYTREEFTGDGPSAANVYAVSYVRKF
jgi:outer membrane immunogenic protein